MEEKERYVYHEVTNEVETYDCYWDNQECCELFDDKAVLNRLNEQDYELKKLNQENIKLIKENQQLKQQLEDAEENIDNLELQLREQYQLVDEKVQQLHDLPKKIVEEVEKNFTEYLPLKYKTGAGFYSRLNAILKKYGGENA